MTYHRTERDWHSALFTATSFLAAFLTLLFGLLDALDCSHGYLQELATGVVCGSAFITSLTPEKAYCPSSDD